MEKGRRERREGREKDKIREKGEEGEERKENGKEWRNMIGRKERSEWKNGTLEILEMTGVLSLVLTNKGPRNCPESLSWMGLQTPYTFF